MGREFQSRFAAIREFPEIPAGAATPMFRPRAASPVVNDLLTTLATWEAEFRARRQPAGVSARNNFVSVERHSDRPTLFGTGVCLCFSKKVRTNLPPRRPSRHSRPSFRPQGPGHGPSRRPRHRHGPPRPANRPRDQFYDRPAPQRQMPTGPVEDREVLGVLEMHPKGYGFLRDHTRNYVRDPNDAYVGGDLISRHRLREGLLIKGIATGPAGAPGPRLTRIDSVEGLLPDDYIKVKLFDDLTPIDPHKHIRLEIGAEPLTMRIMDMFTPIGKGQRALIVAPPRTGKTILLQQLAASVTKNHPELYLIMLLIDERPEEVTEMRRSVRGEVVYSSMDREVENHVRLASLLVERAKRLAEMGKEVFVLLDSITRLARAHNKVVGNSGRTMSGGVDIRAMEIPKKMFGAARVFEEGGSLTVVATALIETGSRMDELIFQEFKGTGNMELVLDRKLADRRTWPAMDIWQSGTRKEEKLLDKETLRRVTMIRRSLHGTKPVEAMESLIVALGKHPSNASFLKQLSRFEA